MNKKKTNGGPRDPVHSVEAVEAGTSDVERHARAEESTWLMCLVAPGFLRASGYRVRFRDLATGSAVEAKDLEKYLGRRAGPKRSVTLYVGSQTSTQQDDGGPSPERGPNSESQPMAEIAGCIGHDLNNLLDVIARSAAMQIRLSPPSQFAEHNRRIQAAVQRAAVLTHQLFGLSEPVAVDRLELPRAMDAVADLARAAAGEAVEIRIESAPDTWRVRADPSDFQRAILNLVINGVQAISGVGTVLVTTLNTVLSNDQAAKLLVQGTDFVQIQIIDSGHGMTTATMARAFEAHFTTKPTGIGTGLGLAQVQAFIRRSGGAIQAASGPGAGTTMSLFLPRALGEDQAEDVAVEARTLPGCR